MSAKNNHRGKVMTNLVFMILGILILSISLSSVSANEEKVESTTLIADNGNPNYVTGNPLTLSYWGVNNLLHLSNSDESDLVNPIYLEEGNYVAKISDGAWSRWRIDEVNTEPWTGYLGDIGGDGLTWESTANIVMKDNGLKIVKFGAMGLFATKEEAENAGEGKEIEFYHEGGNIYVFFDDYITYDNRGSVTIDIYKVSEENNKIIKITDSSIDTSNICDDGIIIVKCTISDITNSVFPYYTFPTLGKVKFIEYEKVGNKYIYSWSDEVDREDIIGTYKAGCYLDNTLDYTDLNKNVNDYPDSNPFLKSFKLKDYCGKENDGNNDKSKTVKIGFNEPIWQCSDWSECIDDVQTRRCEDLNMVEFSYNKPAEVQGCSTTIKSIEEAVKVEKEANYWFWLLVGIGIILLIIIVTLIVRG